MVEGACENMRECIGMCVVCCSVLQRMAVSFCSVFQCVAVLWFNVLQVCYVRMCMSA